MVHSVSLCAPVSPRDEWRGPGASLPLTTPLLLRVDATSYNQLCQDVDLASVVFQAATRGAGTVTAFHVSAALHEALCSCIVGRLLHCPIVGPCSLLRPMESSLRASSEFGAQLEELMGRMKPSSYGPTEPHLWLVGKIFTRTWNDCRGTSQRKSRRPYGGQLQTAVARLSLP